MPFDYWLYVVGVLVAIFGIYFLVRGFIKEWERGRLSLMRARKFRGAIETSVGGGAKEAREHAVESVVRRFSILRNVFVLVLGCVGLG